MLLPSADDSSRPPSDESTSTTSFFLSRRRSPDAWSWKPLRCRRRPRKAQAMAVNLLLQYVQNFRWITIVEPQSSFQFDLIVPSFNVSHRWARSLFGFLSTLHLDVPSCFLTLLAYFLLRLLLWSPALWAKDARCTMPAPSLPLRRPACTLSCWGAQSLQPGPE